MDRLLTLSMFVEVAQRASFSAAARALRTSPTAVTRGVAELEQRLGRSLFHRSTRAVSLTDEGNRFLPRAQAILADLQQAEREVGGRFGEPSGDLHITAPVSFGRRHVIPVACELADRHPRLFIRTLFVDRNVRMVEEGIDVAVRIGPLPDSAMTAVKIGEVRSVMVASPGYLARFGVPDTAAALTGHRLIATGGPRSVSEWKRGGRDLSARNRPRMIIDSVDGLVEAACRGVGIANLLSYQVDDAVARGALIVIPEAAPLPPLPVNLLFEPSRSGAAATRAFIDAMRDYAGEQNWL